MPVGTVRMKTALFAVVSLLLLSSCSSLNPLNWWESDPGPKMAELPQIQPVGFLRQVWQYDIGGMSSAGISPAVTGTDIYVASTEGQVSRIESASGKVIWRISAGARLSGGVGSDGSVVVVASPEGEVVALEPGSGSVRWRARVSSEVLVSPVIATDLVLVRSSDSRLFALDVRDGRRRWVYQRSAASLGVRSPAGIAVANGHAYGGFAGGKLVAIALSNGGVRWEGTVSLPRGANELDRITDVVGLPWVTDHEACAVSFQGRVACFGAINGNLIWAREMSSVSGVDADTDHLYVSDDKASVHALSRATGTSIWRQDRLLRRSLSAPTAVGRQVIVGDIQGFLHMISRDTGAFVGRTATDGSAILTKPRIMDGKLLVLTRGGKLFLYAIE